jgi:hypothetical protein
MDAHYDVKGAGKHNRCMQMRIYLMYTAANALEQLASEKTVTGYDRRLASLEEVSNLPHS